MSLLINENDVVNFKKHPIGIFSSAISQLIEPLKNSYGINYFGHARVFAQGESSYLTTHPQFSEDFTNNQFYKQACLGDPKDYKPGYYLLDTLSPSEVFNLGRERYDLDHLLLIIKKHNNYSDNFYFATSSDNLGISNTYLNNISVFDSFTDYFKERAQRLIQESSDLRLKFPAAHCQETLLTKIFDVHDVEKLKFSVSTLLTPKEKECAFYLVQCLGLKEVASKMAISPRTLEKHIAKLKLKLNCKNMTSLVVSLRKCHEFNY